MYRAADDIFRKTKQAVEIYAVSTVAQNIVSAIATAQSGASAAVSARIDALVEGNSLTEA